MNAKEFWGYFKDWARQLFDLPTLVNWVIVLFIIALIVLWATPSRGSDLNFEAGSAVVRGWTPTIGVHIAFPEQGPVGTDYEVGFNLVGRSTHHRENSSGIVVHGLLVDGWKKTELGLGLFAMNSQWEYTCQFGFQLLARYRFTDHFFMQARHFSSAGSCKPNAGRDLLTWGWRF